MSPKHSQATRPILAWSLVTMVALAACIEAPLGAASVEDGSRQAASGETTASAGTLRLRCDLRTSRSKISVDGQNLLAGDYSARVTSGDNSAMHGPLATVGDEVEFDFDSDPGDVAAGATAIARDFIDKTSSPHVSAQILAADGTVVLSGRRDCGTRSN